jgi:uncharacterized protein (TIGR03085 family)
MTPVSPEQPPHRRERHALCQLMVEVGPDAPTLCEGWDARHLAAHLVVRERRPVAAAGLIVPAMAGATEAAMRQEMDRHTFEELVALVDGGPPWWWRGVDRFVNLLEFVVHHEDVRRGRPDWKVRPESEVRDTERLVWLSLRRGARLLARRVKGVELELRRPDGDVIRVRPTGAKAVVTGRPIEVLMYLMGRRSVADVSLTGDEEALATLAGADLSL